MILMNIEDIRDLFSRDINVIKGVLDELLKVR